MPNTYSRQRLGLSLTAHVLQEVDMAALEPLMAESEGPGCEFQHFNRNLPFTVTNAETGEAPPVVSQL
jgi:hypothetical protein